MTTEPDPFTVTILGVRVTVKACTHCGLFPTNDDISSAIKRELDDHRRNCVYCHEPVSMSAAQLRHHDNREWFAFCTEWESHVSVGLQPWGPQAQYIGNNRLHERCISKALPFSKWERLR